MITNEKEMMAALLATEAGRLFCAMLMRETGVFAPTARDNVNATYLCEGERNVGIRVFSAVLNAGGDPIGCMKEYAEWDKQNQKRTEEREEQTNG